MSPDAVSLLFPDRPIRPLPKRRLRERLSPEVANSIKYPSHIHDHIPLFYYPSYTTRDDNGISALTSIGPTIQHHRDDSRRSSTLRRNGAVMTAVFKEELRGSLVMGSSPKIQSVVIQASASLDPLRQTMELQVIPSTASSVDGYESFENTNNKKKRKIPTTGDSLANNGLSLGSNVNALSTSMRARSPVTEVPTLIFQAAKGYLDLAEGDSGDQITDVVLCELCQMEATSGLAVQGLLPPNGHRLLRKSLYKDKRMEVSYNHMRPHTGQCLLPHSSRSPVNHKRPELYSGQAVLQAMVRQPSHHKIYQLRLSQVPVYVRVAQRNKSTGTLLALLEKPAVA
ncbi:hypothetical protein ACHAQJ_010016 [Trichoderma viride]